MPAAASWIETNDVVAIERRGFQVFDPSENATCSTKTFSPGEKEEAAVEEAKIKDHLTAYSCCFVVYRLFVVVVFLPSSFSNLTEAFI